MSEENSLAGCGASRERIILLCIKVREVGENPVYPVGPNAFFSHIWVTRSVTIWCP